MKHQVTMKSEAVNAYFYTSLRLGAIMHKKVPFLFDVNTSSKYDEIVRRQTADQASRNTWLQEIAFETEPIPEIVDNAKINITNGMYGHQRATYFSMSERGSCIDDSLRAWVSMHKASLMAEQSNKKSLLPFPRHIASLRQKHIQVRSLVTEEVGQSLVSLIERDDFFCYKAVNKLYVDFEQRVQDLFEQNATLPGCNMKRLFLCMSVDSQRLVYLPEYLGQHSENQRPQIIAGDLGPTMIISNWTTLK